jgi:exopolysaccharide biosynthesis polyprenyl glycosylphosphotransferase
MIRLFKVSIPGNVVALVVSEIVLVFSCYLLAAYLTIDVAPDIFLTDDGGLWHIALVVAVIILGVYFNDLYEDYRVRSRMLLLQQTSLVLGMAFVLQAALSYGRSGYLLPKWLMVYGSTGVLLLLPGWRIAFDSVVSKALGAQRILFLGSSPAVHEIISHIAQRPDLGLAALGFLDREEIAPEDICGAPLLGGVADLRQAVAEQQPDRIVVGMSERRDRLPMEQLLQLRLSGVHIEEASVTFETLFHRVSTRDLRPSQLIFSTELGPRPQSVALQSIYSWLLGLIGLAVTLPIMIVVAVLVKAASPGPALFRQTRVGLGGTTFTLFKFRSMYRDAEASTGAVWATRDDPRITPLGRWLRRLRLDELPQLFNVIRGDMSIVGPRPERPEFVQVLEERIPYYVQRHCIKPGITGWAQINYKYGETIEDSLKKLEYDLYYIKNLALSLDAYIIFHTLKIMLLARGAQ